MARIEEREIEANGLRFEVLASGPSDGEPVILLHGCPQNAASWRETIDWLSDHGYRVLAPNLRGYSPGANPPDASAYAMDTLVADVIGMADAERMRRFHLVGHDWGGALAWMLAGSHPERLLSLTVVSTPHPAALRTALRSSTQALRSSYMGFFRLPRVPELLMQAGNYAQMGLAMRLSGLPKRAWERDRAHLRRVGGLRGPLNWYRGAATSMGKVHRTSVPTMYVWGRHDFALGSKAAHLTAKFVTGVYRFVDLDAGHWIPDRNAAELNRLLEEQFAANGEPPAQKSSAPASPIREETASTTPRRRRTPSSTPAGAAARPARKRAAKRTGSSDA